MVYGYPAFKIEPTMIINGYIFQAAVIQEDIDSALATLKGMLEQGVSAYICPLTNRQVVIYIRKKGEQKHE
jgi:hypothetical protein